MVGLGGICGGDDGGNGGERGVVDGNIGGNGVRRLGYSLPNSIGGFGIESNLLS